MTGGSYICIAYAPVSSLTHSMNWRGSSVVKAFTFVAMISYSQAHLLNGGDPLRSIPHRMHGITNNYIRSFTSVLYGENA